ncbi:MAG: glycosyltransferase family 2 protein [Verrucomicrobiia bacterium]|jgi:cellulose synthase/poly-beta-1,6-N-acetylglucosamine synthase-like glycosyltransferase
MTSFWITVFIVSATAIVWSYAIYPLLLALVPTRRHEQAGDSRDWPSVSVLISVYNEEKHIVTRIENLLALDYPHDKLEILIGSDGSTDRTNELVETFPDARVRLHAFEQRGGKPSVLNRLVPQARSELLVFSDANAMFSPDALRKLARHFANPQIDGVCGKLVFHGDNSETDEGPYWKLETYLKTRESTLDSCLGANGAIYAIRKSCWPRIPDNTFVDDFVIGMRVRESGHRVIYDTEAVASEELPQSVGHEMTRRIRIGAGDFQALFLCWRSLLPWRGFYSIAFWSHKVLRWFAPFLMIAALVSNAALLPRPLFAVLLALQLAFYSLAFFGAFIRRRKIVLFSAPYYFVTINLALLLGFFRFVTGTQQAAWKRTAR